MSVFLNVCCCCCCFFLQAGTHPQRRMAKTDSCLSCTGTTCLRFLFLSFHSPCDQYIYIFFFLSCKPFCSLHESLNSKPNSSFSDHPDTSTQHRHTRPYLKPTSKLIGYSQGCLLLKYLSLCTSVVFYKLIFFIFFFHRDIHPVLQENDGLNMA